jgi:hypothetical protein
VVTPTNGFSGVFNPSNPTAFNGTTTIMDRTSNAYGGAIWHYDFGKKSFLELGALFGWVRRTSLLRLLSNSALSLVLRPQTSIPF